MENVILISSDENIIEMVLDSEINQWYEIISFPHTYKALNFIKKSSVDFVLYDSEMPGFNSEYVIKIIKKLSKNTKIIILGNKNKDLYLENLVQNKNNRIYYKPIKMEEIFKKEFFK